MSSIRRRDSLRSRVFFGLRFTLGVSLLSLLALPLLTLISALPELAWLLDSEAASARSALWLSAQSSALSLGLTALMGTPLAWWIARSDTWLARLATLIISAPLFLPPSIVGLTLLETFSREGWLSSLLSPLHLSAPRLAFSYGAVIIAQVIVSAPLFVLGAAATLRDLPRELIEEARCLGATPRQVWWRVTLPLLGPGLMVALSLAGARALGEFGATLLFAGNLEGYTQTAPLAIYLELERSAQGALALSLGLLGYALPMLGGLAYLGRRLGRRGQLTSEAEVTSLQ